MARYPCVILPWEDPDRNIQGIDTAYGNRIYIHVQHLGKYYFALARIFPSVWGLMSTRTCVSCRMLFRKQVQTHNLKVTGSNPVPEIKKISYISSLRASLAGRFLRSFHVNAMSTFAEPHIPKSRNS